MISSQPQIAISRLQRELSKIVGASSVFTLPTEMRAYECDAYAVAKGQPSAVVLVDTTEQVSEVVKLCNRLEIPFIARGAGTGLSGGATAMYGGVVISLIRMNRILSIDTLNRRIVAQAGCISLNLSKAVAESNLQFAPDPSSQGNCTIGGNVAENSGGPHTLKYGVTTNHVTGLRMVMPDGDIVDLGSDIEDAPGYDLVGIVNGSEGTFGIVTEVTCRLTPLPRSYRTLLAVFETIEDATQTVSGIIAAGLIPGAIEMVDRVVLGALEAAFHIGLPQDATAMVVIELDGFDAGLDDEAARARVVCEANHAREVRVADTPEQRAALWNARKKGVASLGRLAPTKVTQDGVIPRSKLPEVLKQVAEIATRHNILVANIFHAGDGNLHPCFLFDERDPDQMRRMKLAGREILELCVRVGGSITGEHGIGVEKRDAMSLVFSQADIALMNIVRQVFDPDDLCNPCKLLPPAGMCPPEVV